MGGMMVTALDATIPQQNCSTPVGGALSPFEREVLDCAALSARHDA